MHPRPLAVERYLDRHVAPQARGAEVVEVDMEGRIKLKARWYDFRSTLRVGALQSFRWDARVHGGALRFSGHDQYVAGKGEMDWRAYGLVPVVHEDSPDITHSARGRAALEQVFLPAALARPEVLWAETSDGWARASWVLDGEEVEVDLRLDPEGTITAVRSQRWSDAEGRPWRHLPFGGTCEGEVEGDGLVVPARFTVGWFYGTARWPEGRFFEGEVTGLRVL